MTGMDEYITREELAVEFMYADADVVADYGNGECEFGFSRKRIQEVINGVPSSDVAPVRHGRWITEFDDLGWLKHTCTVCGYVKRTDVHVSLGWNYCPICGQKADGGEA